MSIVYLADDAAARSTAMIVLVVGRAQAEDIGTSLLRDDDRDWQRRFKRRELAAFCREQRAETTRQQISETRERGVPQLYVNWHTTARKPLIRLKQPPGRFAYYQGAF